VYNHCFDCSLAFTFINETQFHDWEIYHHLCGITLNGSKWLWQPKPFYAISVYPQIYWELILHNVIISFRRVCKILGNWNKVLKMWSTIFYKSLVNMLNKIFTLIVSICLLTHLWMFYIIVSQFLHILHFGHKPHIISNGVPWHISF
jgi:hypothetical protein